MRIGSADLVLGGESELEHRARLINLSVDLSTWETLGARAIDLIENGRMTTGLGGYTASFYSGSDAARLGKVLATLRSLVAQEEEEKLRAKGISVPKSTRKSLEVMQGSLDPYIDPEDLKQTIRMIIRSKRIMLEIEKLIPAVVAGDAKVKTNWEALLAQLSRRKSVLP